MIEVFVSYTPGTDIGRLGQTLDAWDLEGLEPNAIQCGLKKFEIHRRVSAENVSRGTYVITRVGCGPVEDNFAALVEEFFAKDSNLGMIVPACEEKDWTSGSVAICRKGVVKQWVHPLSNMAADVLWSNAHRTSVRNAGFKVIDKCPTIHYRLLAGSLPSSCGTGTPH